MSSHPEETISYLFSEHGLTLYTRLPVLTQKFSWWGSVKGSYHYAFHQWNLVSGQIHAATDTIPHKLTKHGPGLSAGHALDQTLVGNTLMIAGFDIVDAHEFDGTTPIQSADAGTNPNAVRLNRPLDISAMLSDGRRIVFTRSYQSRKYALFFMHTLRSLADYIRQVQAERHDAHMQLFKLMKGGKYALDSQKAAEVSKLYDALAKDMIGNLPEPPDLYD